VFEGEERFIERMNELSNRVLSFISYRI
jgi:hypothetical protein